MPATCELGPFVGDDHHGLRQIERREGGIDRQGEDAVGKRDLVILEPVALTAEHDGDGFAGGNLRRHQGCRLGRADHGLGLVVRAGGCRDDEGAIGDRLFQAVEQGGTVENAVGAGRHHARLVVRPALPRRYQPKPRQAEIRHGARSGTDILAELRLDQDDDRPGPFLPFLRLIGPGARHGMLRLLRYWASRLRGGQTSITTKNQRTERVASVIPERERSSRAWIP